jgi:hypothetical protein
MYDPNEAKKSYLTLLKENGTSAALKSAVVVISSFVFNKVIGQPDMSALNIIIVFFFFCFYYAWKSKLIRFLRGTLRGKEFREKGDD